MSQEIFKILNSYSIMNRNMNYMPGLHELIHDQTLRITNELDKIDNKDNNILKKWLSDMYNQKKNEIDVYIFIFKMIKNNDLYIPKIEEVLFKHYKYDKNNLSEPNEIRNRSMYNLSIYSLYYRILNSIKSINIIKIHLSFIMLDLQTNNYLFDKFKGYIIYNENINTYDSDSNKIRNINNFFKFIDVTNTHFTYEIYETLYNILEEAYNKLSKNNDSNIVDGTDTPLLK